MELLNEPLWLVACIIFLLRILDVSLGTLRTISVVHGRTRLAMGLGFFETVIWVVALSQLILRIGEEPVLIVAYAAGFAAGNGVGIQLENRLALGSSLILLISRSQGRQIAVRLREMGHGLTTVRGEGRDGPRMMLYVIAARRHLRAIIGAARDIDPSTFYVADHCSETSYASQLDRTALGWRSFLKRV